MINALAKIGFDVHVVVSAGFEADHYNLLNLDDVRVPNYQAKKPMHTSSSPFITMERRKKPRINCSYPAIIQGRDATGRKFRTDATLTNLSANGLCLVLKTMAPPGNELFVLFRCSSTGPLGNGKAPLIAVDGSIVRSVSPSHGTCTLGVKIQHSRFL